MPPYTSVPFQLTQPRQVGGGLGSLIRTGVKAATHAAKSGGQVAVVAAKSGGKIASKAATKAKNAFNKALPKGSKKRTAAKLALGATLIGAQLGAEDLIKAIKKGGKSKSEMARGALKTGVTGAVNSPQAKAAYAAGLDLMHAKLNGNRGFTHATPQILGRMQKYFRARRSTRHAARNRGIVRRKRNSRVFGTGVGKKKKSKKKKKGRKLKKTRKTKKRKATKTKKTRRSKKRKKMNVSAARKQWKRVRSVFDI